MHAALSLVLGVSALAAEAIPQTPGFHDLVFAGQLNDQPRQIGCNVFLPRGYEPGRRWPMVVYLIGVGDRGLNNGAVYNNGPTMSLKTDKALAEWAPFVVFTPQCPVDVRWDTPGMTQLVAQTIRWARQSWAIDPDRVYLTGLSMGGAEVWRVALEMKGNFAAASPICSIAVEPDRMPDALSGTTACIVCGADDGAYTAGSRQMRDTLRAKGNDVVYVEVPHQGHCVWPAFYASRRFYEFLLLHQRGTKPPTTRPMAEELLAIADHPANSADAELVGPLRQFLAWWFISNCGKDNSPGLKAEALGRKNVFVTSPLAQDVPCRLLFTTAIAAQGQPQLQLAVAAHTEGRWDLVVRANSIEVYRKSISGGEWQELTVDLAQFRGQQVYLELLNCAAGAAHPEGYWGKVELK